MNKNLYLSHLAVLPVLAVLSCSRVEYTEEQLQPEPETLSSLTFLHENSRVSVPMVSDPEGYLIEAKVRWGDASNEEVYSAELTHSYVREGEYLVEIEGKGGTSIEFNDVYGISMVDFSRL